MYHSIRPWERAGLARLGRCPSQGEHCDLRLGYLLKPITVFRSNFRVFRRYLRFSTQYVVLLKHCWSYSKSGQSSLVSPTQSTWSVILNLSYELASIYRRDGCYRSSINDVTYIWRFSDPLHLFLGKWSVLLRPLRKVSPPTCVKSFSNSPLTL